jgi:hypothetical protein
MIYRRVSIIRRSIRGFVIDEIKEVKMDHLMIKHTMGLMNPLEEERRIHEGSYPYD